MAALAKECCLQYRPKYKSSLNVCFDRVLNMFRIVQDFREIVFPSQTFSLQRLLDSDVKYSGR